LGKVYNGPAGVQARVELDRVTKVRIQIGTQIADYKKDINSLTWVVMGWPAGNINLEPWLPPALQ
jgi:hypothetical protein